MIKNIPDCIILVFLMVLNGQPQHTEDHMSNRKYPVLFTSDSIVIDGKHDEAAWADTDYTEDFVLSDRAARAALSTKAKMLWDSRNLYLIFFVQDDDIWSMEIEHDSKLYLEEVVEIFIGPDINKDDYFEIEVNCLQTVFDLFIYRHPDGKRFSQSSWDIPDFRRAVQINGSVNDAMPDTQWICEMSIPFAALTLDSTIKFKAPSAGDVWAMNLYRIERSRGDDNKIEYSAWSPTYSASYHVPEKFGKIVFVKK